MRIFAYLLLVTSALLVVIEQTTGFWISTSIAKIICGNRYGELIDGKLTEQSCGFDADMNMVVLCFAGIVVSIGILLSTRRRS